MSDVILETNLPAPKYSGKVRDTYDLGDNTLLIVATDRISALDAVLPTGIPNKGKVLTYLSSWWFNRIANVVPHHMLAVVDSTNATNLLPFELPPELHGRSMLVRKAERHNAECIVRGYLSGSGWRDYKKTSSVCGIPLPEGLEESGKLPEDIFTPSTKADIGHDENISYKELVEIVGEDVANSMEKRSIAVYTYAHTVALERGIIIADTKFEFGLREEETILIDEVLTPDSSRFWPASKYEPGRSQESFDKQPVRDWLSKSGWQDGQELPAVPSDVANETSERYLEVYKILTGEDLPIA
ncbi:MAG: phosphoribosylaminoimidazolesuccinocarboxamide synthase [Tepidiformaceae bacterium]